MIRFLRASTAIVVVMAVPGAGTAWSGRLALDIAASGRSRDLLFTELLLGALALALMSVLAWLTAAAGAGSVAAVRSMTSRRWPGRRAGGSGRSRPASAVTAAVTAVVLLAAGVQTAAAAPVAGPPPAAVERVVPPSTQPAAMTQTSAPVPVGGWTPAVAAVSAKTAALVVGPPTARDAVHVVVRGESLWSIAAQHLGADATATEISAMWQRWWQANHDVIGDNPDVLLVGQILHPPA